MEGGRRSVAEGCDISIIIPVLNSKANLADALEAAAPLGAEVIVVDGGSSDGTEGIAESNGALVIQSPRGRGLQLARGAEASTRPWLLFLHSDTLLPEGAAQAVRDFIGRDGARQCAGYFRLQFDDPSTGARLLERIANWRSRALGLPYGDQGLLISRTLYKEIGGYDPIPLMEDVAIVRRIGRRRLVLLNGKVRTSAAKYRRDGWLLRPLRNVVCLSLYFLGVSPQRIAKIYG